MSYAAVLFDLDGTLLDTLEDLADSMNAVLQAEGHAVHPIDAYRYFVGDGIENLVRRALPETSRDATTVTRGKEAMDAEYHQRWNAKTKPYPGIPKLLDELTRRQLPIAILSNKPEPFALLTVNALLANWTFTPIRGARPDTPHKPDPTSALAIAEELGLPPSSCLYVGDTDTAMKTAIAADMYALGATWGFRPGEELLQSGAQVLIDKPLELLDLL